MKNGIDLDVAMAMDPHEALAWAVMFGEIEGGEWDWSMMAYRERRG